MGFFKRYAVVFLMKYQWDFMMGETSVQVSGFRDLDTVDGEPIPAETMVITVAYSSQTGVEVIA